MKKAILLSAVVAFSFGAKAQLSIGPEVGFNVSTFTGATDKYTSYMGGRFGLNTNFRIAGDLYLQPGLFYSSKGGNTVTTSTQDLAQLANLGALGTLLGGGLGNLTNLTVTNNISYKINYLQLPVLAVYKFKAGESGQFFVGVGPYAAFLIDGRYKQSSISSIAGVNINTNEDRAIIKDTDISSFDFGVNGNVGYEHNSGFFCRGFYEMGISDNTVGKNAGFGLSLGYYFGSDKAAN